MTNFSHDPHDADAVPLLGLTETRAADRAHLAALLQHLAASHGATATVEVGGWRGDRCTRVEINAPGGLSVGIDLDGRSCQPGTHVVAWHITPTAAERITLAGVRLSPSFGQVNPHHGLKATHVARGFEALYWELHRGLALAATGAAYAQEQAA